MKKYICFIFMAVIFISCSSSKEAAMTGNESKKSRKLANEEMIKKAVESRRYVIKFNRLLMAGGGYIDLIPNSNFVIMNGGIASVSLMYSGRSMFSRPISAINFNGHTITYEMKSEGSKGLYSINTKVNKGADNFDFYISIGAGGTCSLSVVNPKIDSVTYYGQVTPIPSEEEVIQGEKGRM
jgi:hypothetical protein